MSIGYIYIYISSRNKLIIRTVLIKVRLNMVPKLSGNRHIIVCHRLYIGLQQLMPCRHNV